jgi:phospholipase/carboxylesterase
MHLDLEGPSLAPLSCGKAVWLVVLLHGRGTDANGVIDLALNWQPVIPKAEFLAVHAPFPCDGGTGRQWFAKQDLGAPDLLEAVRPAAAILDPYLDGLLSSRRLEPSHLALVGFSQGAVMALHVGLRRANPVAGIIAFSGALAGPEELAAEAASKPPVLLVHGEADDIVPFSMMARTAAALETARVPVTTAARRGLGHAIDDDGVILAGDFLTRLLTVKKAKAEELP